MSLLTPQNGAALVAGVAGTKFLYDNLGTYLRNYFTRRDTIVYDLPNLGKPREKGQRIKGTAVVCGGSMAGLWAARVLSDHYEDVLIIEPEAWLATEEGRSNIYDENGIEIEGRRNHSRTRVFQYNTTHAMHWFAYMVLKTLHPNLDEEVKAFDGRIGPHQFNVHCVNEKILQSPRLADGNHPQSYFLSRESLERMTRRLFLESRPEIRWMTGVVKGIETAKGDLNTVTAVNVRLPDNTEITIPATLVADCSGSTQAGLKWLKRLQSPSDVTANGKLSLDELRVSYNTQQNTRTFRFFVPPEARSRLPIPGGYDKTGWPYAFMPLFGRGQRSLLCDRLEGHRIRLMAGTWGDQSLPDWTELKDFYRNISPDGTETLPEWFFEMLDILLEYRDQAEYSDTRYPSLSWVRYEKAAFLPSNFIALGDSVMQPNPTFGQGIAKAIVCAVTLDGALRSSWLKDATSIPAGFSRKYMAEQAQRTRSAWDLTKALDYLFPSTIPIKGEKRSDEFLNAKIADILLLLGKKDEQVMSLVFHTFAFTGSSAVLMQPVVLFKVLSFWVKQRLGLAFDFPPLEESK